MSKVSIFAVVGLFLSASSYGGSTITPRFSDDGKSLTVEMIDNAAAQSAMALYNRFLIPADASGRKMVDVGVFSISCDTFTSPAIATVLGKCVFTLIDSGWVILDRSSGTGEVKLYDDPRAAQVRTAFTQNPDFLFTTPDSSVTMGAHESNFTFYFSKDR